MTLCSCPIAANESLGGLFDIRLRSPLSTLLPIAAPLDADGVSLEVDVDVPVDVAGDVGVGAFAVDAAGHWFQQTRDGVLTPGHHLLKFTIGSHQPMVSEGDRARWTTASWSMTRQVGIFFWSAHANRSPFRINSIKVVKVNVIDQGNAMPVDKAMPRLIDCQIAGMDSHKNVARCVAGDRWNVSLCPLPFPRNPYDPKEFSLDAVVTDPNGRELKIPGFFEQPMQMIDRGDREVSRRICPGRFIIRFRPSMPGRYQVRFTSIWKDGTSLTSTMPDLEVSGPARDVMVRVDPDDPRFFSVGGQMWWPIGINLHSVYDMSSRYQMGTNPTPDRGWFAYAPRIDRFSLAGGTAAEIWLSNWNLGLEWSPDGHGHEGLGRYHEANAARLDAILDRAWEKGVRVNLVIQNHGQASININTDWANNPYNRAKGGPLANATEIFSAPIALAGQEQMRRYIVARYADYPSILGWKLWSEVNLTAGGNDRGMRPPDNAPAEDGTGHDQLRLWHERAAARWHDLDIYRHPVGTHFSGDYRRVYPDIAALPGIDYFCFNAYHREPIRGRYALDLANLLYLGLHEPRTGLGRFLKPAMITEYMGTSRGGAEPFMRCEHASGAWLALVTGHAGSPMSWWFEWIEQRKYWEPYTAIARFIVGEDLRGKQAHSISLTTTSAGESLRARAWSKPGRNLGYIIDRNWATDGLRAEFHENSILRLDHESDRGLFHVEWWDADTGVLLGVSPIDHPGGVLEILVPRFQRHIAFKLYHR